jgi:uncharacterized protein (DUF2141 family)
MQTITLLVVLSSFLAQQPPAKLTVETIATPGSHGVVRIALWRNATGFPKGQPFRSASVEMTDGKAVSTFGDLEPGAYAVSAYYDKNNNGKLDQNLVTKPTEPYGFSNDARGTFGPPSFQEAQFALSQDGRTITVHLK